MYSELGYTHAEADILDLKEFTADEVMESSCP